MFTSFSLLIHHDEAIFAQTFRRDAQALAEAVVVEGYGGPSVGICHDAGVPINGPPIVALFRQWFLAVVHMVELIGFAQTLEVDAEAKEVGGRFAVGENFFSLELHDGRQWLVEVCCILRVEVSESVMMRPWPVDERAVGDISKELYGLEVDIVREELHPRWQVLIIAVASWRHESGVGTEQVAIHHVVDVSIDANEHQQFVEATISQVGLVELVFRLPLHPVVDAL